MTGLDCFRIQGALDRRAVGLEEADRLLVEEHLAQCDHCRGDAELRDGLRALMLGQAPVLSSAARSRLVSECVVRANVERPTSAPAPRRHHAGILLLAAMTASLAVWLVFDAPEMVSDPVAQSVGPSAPAVVDSGPAEAMLAERGARVIAGQAQQGGGALDAGETVAEGKVLSTPAAARLVFGHASVQTTANTKLIWTAEASRLRLLSGRVDVDVDVTAGRAFRVQVPTFRVDVLGTRFVVDVDSVDVLRGKVAVYRQGRAAVELVAGQRWQTARSSAANDQSGDDARQSPSAPTPTPRQPAVAHVADGAAMLTAARRQLAAGRISDAENLVRRAMSGKLSASQRAEAGTLLAECALVGGDKDSAARLYERVAEKHAGTSAGESAAFAAARAKHASGDWPEARALFLRYLTQYPHGRFRADAHRHIREIANREAP